MYDTGHYLLLRKTHAKKPFVALPESNNRPTKCHCVSSLHLGRSKRRREVEITIA